MVNFLCVSTWLVKPYFGVCLGKTLFLGISGRGWQFDAVGWVKRSTLTNSSGYQPAHGAWRMNFLFVPELRRPLFFAFGHQTSWFSCLWTPGLTPAAPWFLGLWSGTETYATGHPVSPPFSLGLEFYQRTFFSAFPDCRQQIMVLPGLHSHISQFQT